LTSPASQHCTQNADYNTQASDNFRNAKRAAEDIKEMLEEIEVFCDENKDALGDMTDFHLALQGLLA
jgi:hypothetical protein